MSTATVSVITSTEVRSFGVIAAYQHRRSGNPEVDALHVAARRAPLIVLAGLR